MQNVLGELRQCGDQACIVQDYHFGEEHTGVSWDTWWSTLCGNELWRREGDFEFLKPDITGCAGLTICESCCAEAQGLLDHGKAQRGSVGRIRVVLKLARALQKGRAAESREDSS